ncbi:MAG: hypothetical protein HOD43_05115 [Candidatus Marinimicrobia bacterium]|jgi:hypothetical protein|nr:hypothetical protein [Candidatus Neomarinimicrobiota bacterium]MBT4132661.1 hypothetical protein [Candidatus Neomarinimicrobiota bacterium]MBT4295168.1 hypothetical protein [Candidatus Neomarinimicrobiota bacterium]MBT4419438.1 hypothetical protein [Candidatus Neomarinimicrobiota bacterium]MBT4992778.1 hypothetical protein [Candidatus Neomarinimicrobiota bacterium]
MNTERKQFNDLKQFLRELHTDQPFEIFTTPESKSESQPKLFPSSVPTLDPDILDKYNQQKYGIWFTPNSMKDGKRNKPNVSQFNAIVLDMDFNGTGEDTASQKSEKLQMLLNLQLIPTVIVETRNGYHLYWFLVKDDVTEIEVFEALQILMQQKLDTDPGSLGAEHLFRVPGYSHWKVQDDPFMCGIVHVDYSKRYTYDELVHKYGGVKKLEHLKRKAVMRNHSGKPIKLAEFTGTGEIASIHEGCEVFSDLQNKKDASHTERLALMWTYINLGSDGLKHLRELAKQWNDYEEEVTESNIEYAVNKGYKAPTCKWLQDKGLCSGQCYQIRNYRKPIDFYIHPWAPLVRQNGNRTIFPDNGIVATREHRLMRDQVVDLLEDRGQTISQTHKDAFYKIIRLMSAQIHNDKPIVIPAVPGLGKTTLIIIAIVFNLKYKLNYGAVLVVERQETIQEITDTINSYFTEDKAYPMMGYEAGYCKKGYTKYRPSQCRTCDVKVADCRVKYNYRRQKQYPVVVISHKRLFDMSEKQDLLEALRYWESAPNTSAGKINFNTTHQRPLLLIDERPTLVENVPTTTQTLTTLLADVKKYTPGFYREVLRGVNLIRDHYSSPDDYQHIDSTSNGFYWSSDFTFTWMADYLGDFPEYPELVAKIIREGGLYHGTDHSITTTHYSNTYWQDFSTFIYDGTADLDPDYKDDKFYFADIPHLRPYENLTINVCMEQNLSKTFYQEHTGFVRDFCEDIKEIAVTGNTYVVAYKDYESEYEQHLKNVQNISIEHYGATKGANHLMENVNIVCTGILNKGEPYYLSKTIAITGDVDSFQSDTTDRVRRFSDVSAESIKIFDMVTDLVQEIFRTHLRDHSSDVNVNVYLCTRDANIVHNLKETFQGCTISRSWMPTALLGSRELFSKFNAEHGSEYKTKTKLVKAFLDRGHELTTDDLVDVLGINQHNAARYLGG